MDSCGYLNLLLLFLIMHIVLSINQNIDIHIVSILSHFKLNAWLGFDWNGITGFRLEITMLSVEWAARYRGELGVKQKYGVIQLI